MAVHLLFLCILQTVAEVKLMYDLDVNQLVARLVKLYDNIVREAAGQKDVTDIVE